MAHIKPEQLRSGFYEITGSLYGTASFAYTASHVDNAVVTASAVNDTITFTKGNGTTFPVTLTSIATASYALNALSSSYAATASYINTLYSSNYTQSFTNQSTWTVIHNLDTQYVIVQVYDTAFDEVIPQNIDLTDNNTVTITFPTLESGTAVVTVGGALQNSGAVSSSYAFNATSASYSVTASYVMGGGGTINVPGNNTEILFNSSSALGASQYFKFIYPSRSFQHGYGNIAQGIDSHAQGGGTLAFGEGSHAEGVSTSASGLYSHAEGDQTQAMGDYSHAEGWFTLSSGPWSHAEGLFATSVGGNSHAEGVYTTSTGNYSHAEGQGTNTLGVASHAEGFNTVAIGDWSHAEGFNTISSGSYQHVQGQFNTHGDSTSLMIVGNGTTNNARRDAFKVRMSGSIVLPTTQSAAPSWVGTDGEIVPATVGGQYFLYMWMNGAWRSGSFV
jgi:hypothetical protein